MTSGLGPLLECYPPDLRPTGPIEALGNAGGASGAGLWRFPSPRGMRVARAWPEDGPGLDRIEQIHRWLSATGSLGLTPVPDPAIDGQTVRRWLGRCWEVAPWLPGEATTVGPPPVAIVREAFGGLARLHRSLSGFGREGPSPSLIDRREELLGLIAGGFDRLALAVDRVGNDPAAPLARRWLAMARPSAPAALDVLGRVAGLTVPLQPCLRDARPQHLLFEGDRLRGIVDFGAMAIDCVAADLSRLRADWGIDDPASTAVALDAYEAIRPLGQAEARLLRPFEGSAAVLGGARWVRWHFVDRRRFEADREVLDGLERTVGRLDRAIAAGLLAP